MAFRPQNPFEFVEQMLLQAGQQVSGGFAQGLARTEQRQAERGQVAQQYGLQTLGELRSLANAIGDDDPELTKALSDLAAQFERGILADPSKASEIIGNARAIVSRRQSGVMPFEVALEGAEGAATPRERALGRDVAVREMPFETVTTEEMSPQALITVASGRVGELERTRALDAAERENEMAMQFEMFKSALIEARERAGNDYQFGQNLVTEARKALAGILPLMNMMDDDTRAQYAGALAALQSLATATPQQAFSIYSQAMQGEDDVYGALSTIAGLTQGLTDRQNRLVQRFDGLINGILNGNVQMSSQQALTLLSEVEQYLPMGVIDASELDMVRAYLGVETPLYDAAYYRDNPSAMAASLESYYDPESNLIDLSGLEQRNPELFRIYTADPGIAQNALRAHFMTKDLADRDWAQKVSEDARRVLETGVGYQGLTPEGKADVKRALGNPMGSDAWAEGRLSNLAGLAMKAAVAAHEASIAQSEIQALGAEAQLTDWALAGNYGALIAYQAQDPARADDPRLMDLINRALNMFDSRVSIVRNDAVLREAQARDAMRKTINGEVLNDLEVEALRARFELDGQQAVTDLASLGLRNYGDVVKVLSNIAEVVNPDWWTETELPGPIAAAVNELGMMDSLVALSTASQATNNDRARSEARSFVLDLAKSPPRDGATRAASLANAQKVMVDAGLSEAMIDGFLVFLNRSWDLAAAAEARAVATDVRAEQSLDLQFARYWFDVNSSLAGQAFNNAQQVIGMLNNLVDNRRQELLMEHGRLISLGCAEPGSNIFGGPTVYKSDNTINSGEFDGSSCSIVVEPHLQKFDHYTQLNSWHEQMLEKAIELIPTGERVIPVFSGRGTGALGGSEYGAAGEFAPGDLPPPSVTIETAVPNMKPWVLSTTGQTSTGEKRGSNVNVADRNFVGNYSVANLRAKPIDELLGVAAGIKIFLANPNINDQQKTKHRDNLNTIYIDIANELRTRFNLTNAQINLYVDTIRGNQ